MHVHQQTLQAPQQMGGNELLAQRFYVTLCILLIGVSWPCISEL
jgi:hypothetical protein